jgi:hypothetical protein
LLTPEEKLLELTRARVSLLKDAKDAGLTNEDDYTKAAKAISDNAFEKAPEFSGIDPMFEARVVSYVKSIKPGGT